MPPPWDNSPGALRLPPGAVDKFTFFQGTIVNGATQNILSYTPTAKVNLFVVGVCYNIAADDDTGQLKLVWGGNFYYVTRFQIESPNATLFPYPFLFEGDGSTAFLFALTNVSAATRYFMGGIWAWEEAKLG